MLVSLRVAIKKSRSGVSGVVCRSREIHQLIKDTCGSINWGARDEGCLCWHACIVARLLQSHTQGCTNLPKFFLSPQNSRRQKSGMKQVRTVNANILGDSV